MRQVIGFLAAVIFIAALTVLLSVIDVWGYDRGEPIDNPGQYNSVCNAEAGRRCPGGNCDVGGYSNPFPGDDGGWKALGAGCAKEQVRVLCCHPKDNIVFSYSTSLTCPQDDEGPEEKGTPPPPPPPPPNPIATDTPSPGNDTPTSTPAATPTPTPAPRDPFPTPPLGPEIPQTGSEGDMAPEPTKTPAAPLWRSECLLQHAAAPLNLCESLSKSGWRVYYFGEGQIVTGPYIPKAETMMARGVTDNELLWSEASPTTGKPVMVQWLGEEGRIRVVTYYAPAPHAWHKAYVFDIISGDEVIYQEW